MPVISVALKALESRRYQDPQPNQQIRIDHNSTLNLVVPDGADRVRIEFGYTTSYGALGVVKVEGSLIWQDPKAGAAAAEWSNTRNLPPEVAQQVHTAIMAACVPQAVFLSKELRLPSPIPLPQVRFEQKPATTTVKADPYGSPEIG